MSDISQEAHNALLKAGIAEAVAEATKTTEQALATKTELADTSAARVKELETELADAKSETERLNKELDAAQVKLTSATEEVATLTKAATEAAEQAKLTEVASKRSEQVKNLKLFPEEYVQEKASKWASLSDDDFAEQLEEWKKLKPATAGDATSDAASAMTGTSEDLTKEQQDAAAAGGTGSTKTKSSRRGVLGLA